MADIPELYRLNYPIETPEAEAFWASRHKANRAKAIMAFSLDLDNANDNYRRWNYPRQFRKRALLNFCMYVNQPDMKNIPLSPLDSPWWEEMPYRTDSACGGGGNVPVTGVTISPKTLSLKVGDSSQLSATVAPSNATNKSVTYSTSDSTIATVSSTGLVKAIKTGSVTITVTTTDGGKTDTCSVTITVAASAAPVITTQPKDTSVKVGQAFSMSVVATGTGTLTYQWQEKQGDGSWKNITHTEASWTSAPTAAVATRTFRVNVTNTESGKTPTTVTSNPAVATITSANVDITSMSSASDLMGVYDTTVDVQNVPLPYHVEPTNATIASVKYSMSGDDVTVRGITVNETTGVVTVPAKQVDGSEQTGDNFSVTVTVVDANGHSFSDTSAYHVYPFSRYTTEGVGGQAVTVGQDYNFQFVEEQKNRWGYSFNNESGNPLHFEKTLGFATITVESNDTSVLTIKSANNFDVVIHGEKDGGARVLTNYSYGGVTGQDSTYVSVNDPALHVTQ